MTPASKEPKTRPIKIVEVIDRSSVEVKTVYEFLGGRKKRGLIGRIDDFLGEMRRTIKRAGEEDYFKDW